MNILVVGGAGYVGSHMVKMLVGAGHEVVTLDSLVAGHRDAVQDGTFVHGDIANRELLDHLFALNKFDGVMHFASHIQVGESVLDPAKYYRNNVSNTQNLLDAMVSHDVRHFIFSSTAAIFGEPFYTPIDEMHPKSPINPDGRSKLIVEQMLTDYDHAYGLHSVCLRYFNAAGAHPDGLLGERHGPETHLIPLVLQAASGRRAAISVFGRDYPTADGTFIRDYIHIMDLCKAHLLAMEQLMLGGSSAVYNLGGYLNMKILKPLFSMLGSGNARTLELIKGTMFSNDQIIKLVDKKIMNIYLEFCSGKGNVPLAINQWFSKLKTLCLEMFPFASNVAAFLKNVHSCKLQHSNTITCGIKLHISHNQITVACVR